MKCAKLVGKQKIENAEVPEPVANGNVVIAVKKAGICGSDIHNWDVGEPNGLILGHEFVGTVIDAGPRADLRLGERVTALPISPCGQCPACKSGNQQYCPETWSNAVGLSLTFPGAYAEKTTIRSDLVVKVPDNVSDDEAAMIEPAAVALHAVHVADLEVGGKVLVIGAGIIGDLCAMFAKMNGASLVVVSETNEKRGEKSVTLGCADKWYNAKDEDFMKKVLSDCPYGFDVVLDCSGNSAAVSTAIMCARPNGSVVLVGVSLESITIPSALVVTKEQKLYGAIAYTEQEFRDCLDLVANKKMDVMRFVDDIIPIEDVQKAFERLTSGSDDAIKILIDPTKN